MNNTARIDEVKNGSLYKKIIDYICEEIRSGNLSPHERIPTEMEFIENFGVSRATVIKALSELSSRGVIYRIQGKGSFIADTQETEKKRSLKIISMITPFYAYETNRYDETEMIRGIEKYLREMGYFFTIHFTEQNPALENETIRKCRDENVDGIILYPCMKSDNVTILTELILDSYPIVILDNSLSGLPITSVETDNKRGGYIATKHLVERGFDTVYFVSDYKINMVSTRDRYFGFCKALKEFRKPISEENHIQLDQYGSIDYNEYTFEKNPDLYKSIINKLLEENKGSRVGIFASNDPIAISFVKAAVEMQVKIPENLGIVGFDDLEEGARAVIPLTTIKQNFFEIGRISAKTVLGLIEVKQKGIDDDKTSNIAVDVELIERSTS